MRYGPHKYELYKAKIKIEPLLCQPEAEEEHFNAKDEFEDLEEKVNELVLNLEENNGTDQDLSQRVVELEIIHENLGKKIECPSLSDSKYITFGQKCYYFEAAKKSFADSQANCATKFGSSGGHLAEPMTEERSEELNEYAKNILNSAGNKYWVGFDDLGHSTGDFRYSSTNSKATHKYFKGKYNDSLDAKSNEHCAAYRFSNSANYGYVEDQDCSDEYASICEMKM